MPKLFILTGSNGAGKSTVGPIYFPQEAGMFFDGDKLYLKKRSELWKIGLRVQKELAKQASAFVEQTFNDLVSNATSQGDHFAYEGHFSNDESWEVPLKFKTLGYEIHMVFFGVESPELSADRVLIRAKEGGHFVDSLTLRTNYYGNLRQLNRRFQLFDSLRIIDTSEAEHRVLVIMENGLIKEFSPLIEMPSWIQEYLPEIYAICASNETW